MAEWAVGLTTGRAGCILELGVMDGWMNQGRNDEGACVYISFRRKYEDATIAQRFSTLVLLMCGTR